MYSNNIDIAGFSSHGSASYGTNNSGYSNQQGVYSGSGATTSQSGTMMSTSVSSSKLTNSLAHSVKDSSLLESQHNSSQVSCIFIIRLQLYLL